MHYCAYGFADLFFAAYGRLATKRENEEFAALSQPKRNKHVQQLARLANWQIENVKTKEGMFVAFWPGQ